MTKQLLARPGKLAIFERPTTGNPIAPFLDPVGNLDKVFFHSDFNYYAVQLGPVNKTISFPALSGKPGQIVDGQAVTVEGQSVSRVWNLATHNQGQRPHFMVVYNGDLLPLSFPLQELGSGRSRIVTVFANDTQINLKEVAYAGASALPAMSATFTVLVFREFSSVLGQKALSLKPNRMILGQGKLDTGFNGGKSLRRSIAGSTPYSFARGPTEGLAAGRRKVVLDNSSRTEPGYTGTFAGPAFIPVAVV